jgi:hypothetical protein
MIHGKKIGDPGFRPHKVVIAFYKPMGRERTVNRRKTFIRILKLLLKMSRTQNYLDIQRVTDNGFKIYCYTVLY